MSGRSVPEGEQSPRAEVWCCAQHALTEQIDTVVAALRAALAALDEYDTRYDPEIWSDLERLNTLAQTLRDLAPRPNEQAGT